MRGQIRRGKYADRVLFGTGHYGARQWDVATKGDGLAGRRHCFGGDMIVQPRKIAMRGGGEMSWEQVTERETVFAMLQRQRFLCENPLLQFGRLGDAIGTVLCHGLFHTDRTQQLHLEHVKDDGLVDDVEYQLGGK